MSALERKHIYKVFRNGEYLGLLPNVISTFNYSQQINSGSTDTTIDISQSLATADEAVEPLQTELGEDITTETGETITTERSSQIIGKKDSGFLVADYNDVEIYEISDDDPNGVLVFAGYISHWASSISEREDITRINVISYAKDLDDYVFGNGAFSLEVSQTAGGSVGMQRADQASSQIPFYAQTISGHSFTLSRISIEMALGVYDNNAPIPSSTGVTLRLYSGSPTGASTLLATASATLTSTSFSYINFTLSQAIALSSGTTYWWSLEADNYCLLHYDQSGGATYTGGSAYISTNLITWYVDSISDITFKLYSGGVATNATFTSYDPSQMIRDALDGYSSQGGSATYTGNSIDNTGLAISYVFKLATILEIIQKARDLAPADWYWFVDPATQLLTFKETLTTATHVFLLGRHLNSLKLGSTVEKIKNVVYFSGGPTAGVNLLKLYTDANSLAVNRRGLIRLNDNRVTDAGTASALANAYMDENGDEVFRSDVTLLAEAYDIDSINLGQTVGFSGFGSFVDLQILQITGIRRTAYAVELTLGKLPLQSDSYVDNIRRDLEKEQTLDNPSTPS